MASHRATDPVPGDVASPLRRVVVGVSGASGAVYARRLVRLLAEAEREVHVVISPTGQRLLHDELGIERPDPATWVEGTRGSVVTHNVRDVGAAIASGSFVHAGMVIVPCSSNSLSAVAHGSQTNLLHRAAAVTLKERRPLVLVHRETPLSLIEIDNMRRATEAGAVVLPASPGFYMKPTGIDDLVDFICGRVMDLLRIEHGLRIRWAESTPDAAQGAGGAMEAGG
jgi:4-hydroxy-3-polyprenylbenzoate decarboxylase